MTLNFSTIESQSNELQQEKDEANKNKQLKIKLVNQHKKDLFDLFEKNLFAQQSVNIGNGGNEISTSFGDYLISLFVTNISSENGVLKLSPEKNLKLFISKKVGNTTIFQKGLADITNYDDFVEGSKAYEYATEDHKFNFENLSDIFQCALDSKPEQN